MGNNIAYLQSRGIALYFIVISNNLSENGVMVSTTNFKISPRMSSRPTDSFYPSVDNKFLIRLVLMVKCLPDSVDRICGLLRSQLKRDA
jgi:hypothetical protein